MKIGEKVKFIEPAEDEQNVVFEILEDRGDRVLVTALDLFDNWTIKPTSVYLKSDLKTTSGDGVDE